MASYSRKARCHNQKRATEHQDAMITYRRGIRVSKMCFWECDNSRRWQSIVHELLWSQETKSHDTLYIALFMGKFGPEIPRHSAAICGNPASSFFQFNMGSNHLPDSQWKSANTSSAKRVTPRWFFRSNHNLFWLKVLAESAELVRRKSIHLQLQWHSESLDFVRWSRIRPRG